MSFNVNLSIKKLIEYFSFIALIFFSCSEKNKRILVQNTGEAQGTFYHIQYLSENGESYKNQIDSLLDEVDSSVSIYKPYSIISKLNKGEKLNKEDVICLRPYIKNTISPFDINKFFGKKLKKNIKKNVAIKKTWLS